MFKENQKKIEMEFLAESNRFNSLGRLLNSGVKPVKNNNFKRMIVTPEGKQIIIR